MSGSGLELHEVEEKAHDFTRGMNLTTFEQSMFDSRPKSLT